MWWRPDQLDPIDDALRAAADGRPTLLAIEGDPGQGKSALLREVSTRARGFHLLSAEGVENLADTPYAVVGQWPLPRPIDPSASPFQAAQDVRTLIDRLAHSGPVVITIDDLQWADAESTETIAWILRRAAGDRLLVAAASRPIRPPDHPSWRRMLLEDGTVRLRLAGLEPAEARLLLEGLSPGIEPALATRLCDHTGGNPFYLRALLAEYDPTELAALDDLPAPGDLTAATANRLAELPEDAAELIRAVATLGTGWSPLTLAAGLAGIADAGQAAEVAVAHELVELQRIAGSTHVRLAHTVLVAAVQAGMPTEHRRALQLRAAALVTSTRAALRHRLAGADGYDDALAGDLAAFAAELHARGEFREAGRHLNWSATVTADRVRREARWLDSLFEYVLARDDETVAHQLSDVGWATDDVRRGLVNAGQAIILRRWLNARRILDAVGEKALAGTDARSRYRVVVLRSWCRVMSGTPAGDVLADLSWARTAPEPDPALYGYLSFAFGQAQLAGARQREGWRHADAVEPAVESSTTDTTRLAWRGAVYALGGRFDEAVDILEQVTRQVRDGLAGFGEGVFHTYLGYASWMRGDWPRAQRMLTLALESRFGNQHPMVIASAPLVAIARNDPAAAVQAARSARDALLAAPWPPAVQVAGTATVLTRRLSGSAEERARILPELHRSFGTALTQVAPGVSPVWLVHLALAGLWAAETELAEEIASGFELGRAELDWLGPAALWIRGLVAAQVGDGPRANHLLASAGAGGLDGLPLHRALLSEDLAAVEAGLGHSAAASASRRDAVDRFGRLGLLRPGDPAAQAEKVVLDGLSDRERDVVGLLVEGLSYAQIARELFVTRSTVAFHLSNVYAKTNTSSRHELVDLVRRAG